MENLEHVFWGEIAPSDHFLQIYETDEVFIDSLEAFVCAGITNHDGVIIIATESHLDSLNERLAKKYNINRLISSRHYITLNAEDVLNEILNGDEIDEKRFRALVDNLLRSVYREPGSVVRVFGELVALLWGHGNRKATIQLEKLWENICSAGTICLFCAYPKMGFRQDAIESLHHICSCHNNLIENNTKSPELSIYGERISVPLLTIPPPGFLKETNL